MILGVEGQAREILDAARGGIGIPPENAEALAAAVVTLQTQSTMRQSYGQNGKSYIEENFSRRSTAILYEQILNRLMEEETVTLGELKKSAGAH